MGKILYQPSKIALTILPFIDPNCRPDIAFKCLASALMRNICVWLGLDDILGAQVEGVLQLIMHRMLLRRIFNFDSAIESAYNEYKLEFHQHMEQMRSLKELRHCSSVVADLIQAFEKIARVSGRYFQGCGLSSLP